MTKVTWTHMKLLSVCFNWFYLIYYFQTYIKNLTFTALLFHAYSIKANVDQVLFHNENGTKMYVLNQLNPAC